MTSRLFVLCVCALLASAARLPALPSCESEPAEIVELALTACRPASLAVAEQVAGSPIWWLRPYMDSIAVSNPGVLLFGSVARARRFEPPSTLGSWREGGGSGELFFTSSDPDFCATFEGLERILLVRERPCCDIIPPVSTACLLDVFEVRSLNPDLLYLVEDTP